VASKFSENRRITIALPLDVVLGHDRGHPAGLTAVSDGVDQFDRLNIVGATISTPERNAFAVSTLPKLQVADAVVIAATIDVVYRLASPQRAADSARHDDAML